MTAIRALTLGAVLIAGVASTALAATGETTTATSPRMSSPMLSHDGNNQLGPMKETGTPGRTVNGPRTAASPDMAGPVPSKSRSAGIDESNPAAGAGCGGAC